MEKNKIRNFVIIAHVDHGKSTLADRLLEQTHTIEERKMKSQYLDQLDLERERGITIKMTPVTMSFTSSDGNEYLLHLIDTPGHSDFAYEVSRSLEAVEGAVLLVDVTQGIQAQTLANLESAKKAGLVLIGALNKIDMLSGLNFYEVDEMKLELSKLIGVEKNEILEVSGKTGSGVKELLETIVAKIPPPKEKEKSSLSGRALVFDSFYDNHKGAVASIRVCNGIFKHTDDVYLVATETRTKIKEIGKFFPEMKAKQELREGEIGYIATGIKDTEKIKIGDTVIAISGVGHTKSEMAEEALKGYEQPKPVIFVSFYPEDPSEYDTLRHDLQKLKLNDSSLTIEPDQNEILGRGYKVGCLGRLHFEITTERLKKEYKIDVINTFPSVKYVIKTKNGETSIVKPEEMPDEYIEIKEPIISLNIMFPRKYLSSVLSLQQKFRMSDVCTETIGERIRISAKMPLAELISDFDDCLKSVSEGYASFSYEMIGYETADIQRVDILVSGGQIPGLSRFLPKDTLEREARKIVDKLKDLLPKQQYAQPVQASASGRIIARADISAIKKELGNFGKNGGDRTRKMKLWKKQERGKKRLKERSEASISPNVFKELLKK